MMLPSTSTFCVPPVAPAPEMTLTAWLCVPVRLLVRNRTYMFDAPAPPPLAKLAPRLLLVNVQPEIVTAPEGNVPLLSPIVELSLVMRSRAVEALLANVTLVNVPVASEAVWLNETRNPLPPTLEL